MCHDVDQTWLLSSSCRSSCTPLPTDDDLLRLPNLWGIVTGSLTFQARIYEQVATPPSAPSPPPAPSLALLKRCQ